MNPLNRGFKILTSQIFPEHATRERVARSGHIALSLTTLSLYVLFFGVKPLIAWILYKFLDGEKPEMSWPVAVAAAVILIFIHLLAKPEARLTSGIVFLRLIHLAYDIPSRLAIAIVKRRLPFTVIGVLLIFGSLAVIPVAIQNHESTKVVRSSYKSMLADIKRFVERRRVSEYNTQYLEPIVSKFCGLDSSPFLSQVRQDPSAREFLGILAPLFKLSAPCLKLKHLTSGELHDFEQRVSESAGLLHHFQCNKESALCGYIHAWNAKLHLNLAQEGRILDHTRRAHELFLKAESELKEAKESSSVIDNGLGIVYAQYLSNYSALSREFQWPDLEKPRLKTSEANETQCESSAILR
jgi:hypothetical protein